MTYAGEINPLDTYSKLTDDATSVLVDVRTAHEWTYVGTPALAEIGKTVVGVTWPVGTKTPQTAAFIDALRRAGVSEDQTVLFICRSGGRSRFAAIAATAAGFPSAYNVTDGFEGPIDDAGHRGTTRGWKADNLPWRQR